MDNMQCVNVAGYFVWILTHDHYETSFCVTLVWDSKKASISLRLWRGHLRFLWYVYCYLYRCRYLAHTFGIFVKIPFIKPSSWHKNCVSQYIVLTFVNCPDQLVYLKTKKRMNSYSLHWTDSRILNNRLAHDDRSALYFKDVHVSYLF